MTSKSDGGKPLDLGVNMELYLFYFKDFKFLVKSQECGSKNGKTRSSLAVYKTDILVYNDHYRQYTYSIKQLTVLY